LNKWVRSWEYQEARSKAYELANSKGFPVLRIGRRLIVSKIALMRWMMTKEGE